MKFALRNLAVILALLVLMLFAATVNAEQPVTEHRIPGSMGNVYGVLRMPAGDAPMPLIILSHGFGGSHVGSGTYDSGELPVTVRSLPNAKGFIMLGEGTMRHSMDGFTVHGTDGDGDAFEMIKPVPSLYSCHIEYEYLGKFGDCVDLNTLEDTWYIYPHDCSFAVTKMALATEELYRKLWKSNLL